MAAQKTMIMEIIALIERGKNGSFGIFTPELEHTIIGNGNNVSDAKSDFQNSINEVISYYTEKGIDIPKELTDFRITYKYDLASFFNFYNWINVSKFAESININASLMRQYKSSNQYISENQMKKIEDHLHEIGREISSVRLV